MSAGQLTQAVQAERANAWEAVAEAIDSGQADRVAEVLVRLDEAERRQVAAALPGHLPTARRRAHERYERRQAEAHRRYDSAHQQFLREEKERGLSEEQAHARWWSGHHYRHEHWIDWRERDQWIEPMRVAGAGTIGGAAAVAAWLHRRDLVEAAADLGPILRVIGERPAEWQADLAVRLATRIRATRRRDTGNAAELALELLRRSGAEPPEYDPLVVAWVAAARRSRPDSRRDRWTDALTWDDQGRGAVPTLRDDPLLVHLLPRLFEAEGVGNTLRDDPADPGASGSWLGALRRLEQEGRIDRKLLLDGCVSRFLRGGGATDLRFFARLHELLLPAPDETAPYTRDYLRLLPAAPGPVAELALRQLRGVGLGADDLNEAIEALLFRAESKLVRAGLTWLDQAARAAAGDLDQLAPALGSAFLCDSYDVRERAVRLAAKHARRFTPLGADAVREAGAVLPADLAVRLAEVFGGEVVTEAETDDFQPGELPAVDESAEPFPPPAERAPSQGGVAFESWLAWFVREGAARRRPVEGETSLYDRREWHHLEEWAEAMLREAAAPGQEPPIPEPEEPPAYARHTIGVSTSEGHFEVEFGQLPAAVRESITADLNARGVPLGNLEHVEEAEPIGGEILGFTMATTGNWPSRERKPEPPRDRLPKNVSVPHLVMLRRCAEVHAALKAGTLPPYLLATPTRTDGHLDPAELVARLEGYERAGVEALPFDLQQALLRVPREVAPEVAGRARALSTRAGATLVGWLTNRPEPVTRVDWAHGDSDYTHDQQPGQRYSSRLKPRIAIEPTGLEIVDELLSDPQPYPWEGHGRYMESWPMLLPADREVVAMHLLPHLLNEWERPGYFHRYVAALVDGDGPAGEGLALLLARLLAERGPWHARDAGITLLLRAVARGSLPAAECGRQLGLVLRRTEVKLGGVLESLEDCARQGAHREIWQLVAGMLPVFLPGTDERAHSGHTQVLGFAVRAAGWAGARGPIPAVAEVAARTGSSGFVRTARRLHELLTR
ncbi:DUF6493 family protein [Nonomuraea dietziae]|uniref:DUF7824 domain-containing protein n=1 Tax=Nonomuraea dietziae TaxID=65515 RepID=UPI0033D6B07D